ALARRCFAEARAISDRDGGRLWGASLWGPMLFASPGTRALVGNEPDSLGRLTPRGGVYVGVAPPELALSNTALNWSGKTWTVVMWPLPADSRGRGILMAHELWHRVQSSLGF